tara:strand:- start:249 stop:524 length:276 start_codon:yes stop_codon:yes gene_type:complete
MSLRVMSEHTGGEEVDPPLPNKRSTMNTIEAMNSMRWNTVDVYSVEKRDAEEDNGSMLIKRTAEPVSLSEGLAVCTDWETKGHVVELRRVS